MTTLTQATKERKTQDYWPEPRDLQLAALSALMQAEDPASMDLRPEDFPDRDLRTMFVAVVDVASDRTRAHPLDVISRLEHRGTLAAVGGAVGVLYAASASYTDALLPEVRRRLVLQTARRVLRHVALSLQAAAMGDDDDLPEAVTFGSRVLQTLTERFG